MRIPAYIKFGCSMAFYEVRDVVCDYGVFEDGVLKLILNSRRIALQIVSLLNEDETIHIENQKNIYRGIQYEN